jgi:hypothetical protein
VLSYIRLPKTHLPGYGRHRFQQWLAVPCCCADAKQGNGNAHARYWLPDRLTDGGAETNDPEFVLLLIENETLLARF